ncbi:23 kDa integral membrane protein [Drosophila obscura]|uniref:23 kDa integral membrane protein n=1 Tax=Drosophila obscura TaxID=7282 RepID=UPI000BA0A0DA|nr:23 kDa integral membrane protein [Drosophila obscura]
MGCTTGCIKCFLNALNSLNALVGLALIAIATIILGQVPLAYIVFVYILGGLIFVSAILGCCGICQENVCMTATYGFIMLAQLIFALLGTFGFKFNEDYIRKFASEEVQKMWDLELVEPGAMDHNQITYECCGRNGPDDYVIIGRATLPTTCYPKGNHELPHFTTGCAQGSSDNFLMLFNYASNSNWISVGITALMILGAFYLVGRFRKQRRRYHY